MTLAPKALAAFVVACLFSALALAARPARVDVQDAELYEGPGRGFRLIEKLPKGTGVAISNVPTEGYFKVRTSAGTVGWIAADALQITDSDGSAASGPVDGMPVAPTPRQSAPPGASESGPGGWADRQFRPGRNILRLRLLGGYGFFKPGDINDQVNTTVIRNGFHFGGEINFLLPGELALVVRVENVLHGSLGRSTDTGTVFQWNLSSWPAMIGFEMNAAKESKFSSQFAVMGGLALATSFTSTSNLAAPNVTAIERYGFAGLARFTLNWHFTKTFFTQVELGYRYLSTQKGVPSVVGNGNEILKDSALNFVPVAIDLSGPVGSVGVGFML